MSVRAYKIKKIDCEKSETFNLWHNPTVASLIDRDDLNMDGCGVIEIQENDITGLIDEIKNGDTTLEKEEDKKETLAILNNMKQQAKGTGYVDYYCY